MQKAFSDLSNQFWKPIWGSKGAVDEPLAWDLIDAYEDIVFAVVSLRCNHISTYEPKLYVTTNDRDSFPKCPSRTINTKAKENLQKNYGKWIRKARDVREVKDYPLLDIIDRPNPHHNWNQFAYIACGYYDITGSCFIEKVNVNIGPYEKPGELYILPTQNVRIEYNDEDGSIDHYVYTNGESERIIPVSRMIHWRYFNPCDPYYDLGFSPLRASWKKLQLLRLEIDAWTSVLNNASQPNLVISPIDKEDVLTDLQVDRISKQIMERFSHDNEGRPLVLQNAMNLNNISPKPTDMKAIQISEQIKKSVCAAFHVPLTMLEMPDDAQGMNGVRRAFQADSLKPTVTSFCEALTQGLVDNDRLFFAVNEVVQRDYGFELQQFSAMFQSNVITVNEYRASQGLEPDARNGDKYLYQIIGAGVGGGTMGTLPSFHTDKALDIVTQKKT